MKILILGAGGMLGHKVAKELSDLNPIVPSRSEFDVTKDEITKFKLSEHDYIINCVGGIPQKGKTNQEMITLNANFPRLLARLPQRTIQIATDCVYSGLDGGYSEISVKDPNSVYGASKASGEVVASNMMHIRTSIIGPELTSKQSLFEWVRNQPEGATVMGYANHRWNGVTTEAFAKVAKGIITNDLFKPTTQHLVPEDSVSKAELIRLIAKRIGRDDLNIVPQIMPNPIDRTLKTIYKERNLAFWRAGGYAKQPRIADMIGEMGV